MIRGAREVVAAALLLCTPCAAQITRRVSVDGIGTQGNGLSFQVSISRDGRFVAFSSVADNLVPGDTNSSEDVFVHDRQSGATERVNVASSGQQVIYPSGEPSISSDGRFVAFTSTATSLVSGDTNEQDDVFVHDRETGVSTRVSIATDGTQGNSFSRQPSISSDGRVVAFSSVASNWFPGDTNGTYDVFVHDRRTGATTQVSVDPSGASGNDFSGAPDVSLDGRFVAFTARASNFVPGDTNGLPDVFVRDRRAGVTTRVSVASDGSQASGASQFASISADGRFVAFTSVAANLVPGDTNGVHEIFVHDRRSGTTERVSVDSMGEQGDGYSHSGRVSSDGRHVAFSSNSTNLVPGDTNGFVDLFVHDRASGNTTRVSVASAGAQGNWDCGLFPSISGDGRFVAFHSSASNLVPGDTNQSTDVFVHDRDASGFTSMCVPGYDNVIACPCANPPSRLGRGCDNATATGGAVLSVVGAAYLSQDELVFTTSGENPSAFSILLQGDASVSGGAGFGRGVRCAGGSILRRLYTHVASGGSITVPDLSAGDPTVSERSAEKGDVIQAGESRWYLVYYRDPVVSGGCQPTSVFNATQTGSVQWSL